MTIKFEKPLVMSDAFEKIAIVADRDNREVSEIETEASAFLKVPCGTIKNNQWNDCSYTNEFRMEKNFFGVAGRHSTGAAGRI